MRLLSGLFSKKTKQQDAQPLPGVPGMSFNNQNQEKLTAYLYIIFSLFAVSFFGFFALRPTISTISNLQKQLGDSRTVYASLKTKLEALRTLDGQYEQLQGVLPIVYAAIPKTSQIPTLTRQFEKLAQSNQLTINSIDFGTFEYYPATSNNRQLYSYTFTIDVQGTEPDVDTFISSLISFDRILSIDKISTGRNQAGEFQATIAGQAYYYGDEKLIEN